MHRNDMMAFVITNGLHGLDRLYLERSREILL
jgi:hypothetical protein